MLKLIPPKFPPRRRRKYIRRPPPPAPVTVLGVTYVDGYTADWTFSAAVTLLGANVPELQIDGWDLVWASPSAVMRLSPTVLRGDYSATAGLRIGDAWRIIVQPGNIEQPIDLPQEGVVQ